MINFIYSLIGLTLLGLNSANAGFFDSKTPITVKPNDNTADVEVQRLIQNGIGFLYLVAVVYGLWGGFNILTAGGNDEKVKKGKTVIIQALIGLVVIWLASSVVSWIITKILT